MGASLCVCVDIGIHINMCRDICTDMPIDTCMNMGMDMCMDICMNMCVEYRQGTLADLGPTFLADGKRWKKMASR